ncbi:MAG: fibronectin type III domain-containing protein, partial [Gemmatimonadota bacterium]
MSGRRNGRIGAMGPRLVWLAAPLLGLLACQNDSATDVELPPTGVTVQTAAFRDTLTVSWSLTERASGYRVEVAGDGVLSTTAGPSETSVKFTASDGLADGVTYTATVYALNGSGETASNNTPQVAVNFFPWDEYFPTSLHRTGMGKQTFYNAIPNGGFESLTGIPYDDLVCKGCHTPGFAGGAVKGERGCQSCHETDDPQLGAEVDATLTGVCGPCHSRQKAEAFVHGFSDVHRDAGMDCMACHTLGDVHGDGNEYVSMLDPGAMDTKCADCHAG